MTTSITVADTFEKRHSDVLRSIQTLECSPEFSQRNFALTEYSDAQGRRLYVYY
ncbi:MAG: Rha family transcriptional regulator [Pseudomonadota bacterium]